jgi:hypothetical protein
MYAGNADALLVSSRAFVQENVVVSWTVCGPADPGLRLHSNFVAKHPHNGLTKA